MDMGVIDYDYYWGPLSPYGVEEVYYCNRVIFKTDSFNQWTRMTHETL